MVDFSKSEEERARLVCAGHADGDSERLIELLDMLALWPNQQGGRRVSSCSPDLYRMYNP